MRKITGANHPGGPQRELVANFCHLPCILRQGPTATPGVVEKKTSSATVRLLQQPLGRRSPNRGHVPSTGTQAQMAKCTPHAAHVHEQRRSPGARVSPAPESNADCRWQAGTRKKKRPASLTSYPHLKLPSGTFGYEANCTQQQTASETRTFARLSNHGPTMTTPQPKVPMRAGGLEHRGKVNT